MQNVYGKTFLYCPGEKCPIQCLSGCSHLVSSHMIHMFMSHRYQNTLDLFIIIYLNGGY